MLKLLLAVAAFLFLGSAWSAGAEPKVNYAYPKGLRQDSTAVVDVAGYDSDWPPQVWTSHAGLQIQPGDKGKLSVTAGKDLPAGIHLFRLYNTEGATTLQLIVVGTLAEQVADESLETTQLKLPVVVNGKLEKRGDVDTYRIDLEQGDTLVASLHAHWQLKAPMDGVLQVCDEEGFVIEQNDDQRGLDPLIVFQAPRGGEYLVRCFAFPETPNSSIAFDGGEAHVYRLTLTRGPFLDFTLPLAVPMDNVKNTPLRPMGWNLANQPEWTIGQIGESAYRADVGGWFEPQWIEEASWSEDNCPEVLTLPASVSGVIDEPGQRDGFGVRAVKDQTIELAVASREFGFPMDAAVRVLDPEGNTVIQVDDTNKQSDPSATWTCKLDGVYRVEIRDVFGHGSPRHAYLVRVRTPLPDFRLTTARDVITVAAGGTTDVEIAVERTGGLEADIQIDAATLPEGVSVEPVVSAGKGDTAKKVKLKITAGDSATGGPLGLQGTRPDDASIRRSVQFQHDRLERLLPHLWIHVGK